MEPMHDTELFLLIQEKLHTPVLGDILDREGRYHQFLPQPIKPLNAAYRLVGRAMPVQIETVEGPQKQPFGRMMEALDSLGSGEVYVATGGAMNCAAWGEIMTARARTQRAAGAVIDGFHRDTARVLEQDWPVFSRGSFAQDAGVRSIVTDFRCVVRIGEVVVEPGDLIVADIDGVLVVPRSIELRILEAAMEKIAGEKVVRREIESGATTTAVFDRYGIL